MYPLQRYNEIQKALSSFRRESGIKSFPASFQKTASQIYKSTKGEPLKHVLQNIDISYKNILPEIPADALTQRCFFDYEDAQELLPAGLGIRCPQLRGDNWIESDTDYNIVFKDFSDYCNANKDIFWTSSGDAPRFQFGDLDFDDTEGIYYLDLIIDREDTYGYQPGMGGKKNFGIGASELKAPIKELEDEIPEEPEEKIKPVKDDIEIRRIEAETEKIKASKEKLEELNKAVESLDKKFDRGLISKTEYKKYLKKIYEI